MARPREFDEKEALDRALEVFWKQGYRNTSLDDLLDAMGIQRGSFYNTFGSKRDVYLRALERYREIMADGGPYTSGVHGAPGAERLQAIMDTYLNSLTHETGPKGCFFAHASTEHRGDDPVIRDLIRPALQQMRGLIQESVEAGQAQGQLPAAADPRDVALLLMSVVWGMHALAEAGIPKDQLAAAGRQLFTIAGAEA